MSLLKTLLGESNSRKLKQLGRIADKIEALEPQYKALTDAQLREQTTEFKTRLFEGATLDDILPEAYAVVREAAWRVLRLRAFRVQLMGAIALHQGRIAEMKTGEGKTLVAVFPAYLNALTGKGVHIVTVNDYLAKRDCDIMGNVCRFLGLTVGLIIHEMSPEQRRQSYLCDITYGTNNEFGFDYLRDNMALKLEDRKQRELNFAIVDEADSIFIDEARTPLIISGRGEKSSDLYKRADELARTMRGYTLPAETGRHGEDDSWEGEYDYAVDEKTKTVRFSEMGIARAERFFGIDNICNPENTAIYHHVINAIKANSLMKRDVDYIVKDNQVVIVDEFTGRLMFGRRYNDGLHQAIEAKEGVVVEQENVTLASITLQNYFRMYKKIAGMTGTAKTEEEELRDIYGLDVVEIPTNRPMIRIDHNDAVLFSLKAKYEAVANEVERLYRKGQPVLVGTVSVEKSEIISGLLDKRGIPHRVLNAKNHAQEADIIAQAGRFKAVTIATNMAGRGTDIILGGNPEMLAKKEIRLKGYDPQAVEMAAEYNETDDLNLIQARAEFQGLLRKYREECQKNREKVIAAGGLYVLGTERHESRRIDNQLRGRAGRQGDPGESRFYLSLEDDLIRLFGGDRLQGVLGDVKDDPNLMLDIKLLSRQIENAQKKVEARNYNIRKKLLEYDDVMNQQRNLIYSQRLRVQSGADLKDEIIDMMAEWIKETVRTMTASRYPEEWDLNEIAAVLSDGFLPKKVVDISDSDKEFSTADELTVELTRRAVEAYEEREAKYTSQLMRQIERFILLQVVDFRWRNHIEDMEALKDGIGLRAYAQIDPVVAYKKEAFEMFEDMVRGIRTDTVRLLMSFDLKLVDVKVAPVEEATA